MSLANSDSGEMPDVVVSEGVPSVDSSIEVVVSIGGEMNCKIFSSMDSPSGTGGSAVSEVGPGATSSDLGIVASASYILVCA